MPPKKPPARSVHPRIIVTHVSAHEIPDMEEWKQPSFFRRVKVMSDRYYQTRTLGRPANSISFLTGINEGDNIYGLGEQGPPYFSQDKVDAWVRTGIVIEIDESVTLAYRRQGIYLAPDGKLYVADKKRVAGDPNKRIVGDLSSRFSENQHAQG